MAKDVVLNIKIETDKATKSVSNFNKEIDKTVQQTGNIKQRLRELQLQMAEIGDASSPIFQEMAREAGILKDQIGGANQAITAMASDAPKLETTLGVFNALGGATQALLGSMSVLGIENEEVTKSIQRMVAVQSVMNGVNTIAKELGDESMLGIKLRTLWTQAESKAIIQNTIAEEANAVATGVQSTATSIATTKMQIFNQVLKANPIMATIGALLLLAGAIYGVVKVLDKQTDKEKESIDNKKKLIDETKRLEKESKAESKAVAESSVAFVSLVTQLKNTNKNSKERKDLIKDINVQYGTTLKNIQDETKFQESLNFQILEYVKYQKAKYASNKYEDLIQRNLETQSELQKKLNKQKEEYNKLSSNVSFNPNNDYAVLLRKKLLDTETELKNADERLTNYGKNILDLSGDINNKFVPSVSNSTKVIEKNNKKLQDASKDVDNLYNAYKKLEEIDNDSKLYNKGKEIESELQTQLNAIETDGKFSKDLYEQKLKEENDLRILKLKNDANIKRENATNAIEIEVIDAQLKLDLEKNDDEYYDKKKSGLDKLVDAQEKYSENIIKDDEKTLEERLDLVQQYTDKTAEILNNAAQLLQEFSSNQLEKGLDSINSIFENDSNKLEEQLANRILSQEEYDVKLEQLNQQREQREKTAKNKAFKDSKRLQLVQATIQGSQAVLAAYSSGLAVPLIGPATGAIYAGIAAAMSATQISLIAGQTFKAAKGGIVPGNGDGSTDTVKSLLAPGETVINARSSKMFANELSNINMAGGGIPLVSNNNPNKSVFNNNGSNNETIQIEVKANVLENDITNSQNKINRIKRNKDFFAN